MKNSIQATIDLIKKSQISQSLKTEILEFYESISGNPDANNLFYDFLMSKAALLSLDLTKLLINNPKTSQKTSELIKKYI